MSTNTWQLQPMYGNGQACQSVRLSTHRRVCCGVYSLPQQACVSGICHFSMFIRQSDMKASGPIWDLHGIWNNMCTLHTCSADLTNAKRARSGGPIGICARSGAACVPTDRSSADHNGQMGRSGGLSETCVASGLALVLTAHLIRVLLRKESCFI